MRTSDIADASDTVGQDFDVSMGCVLPWPYEEDDAAV
jgi:hypothetical protein